MIVMTVMIVMMVMIGGGGCEDHGYDDGDEFYLDENLPKHVSPIAITSGT